MPIRFLPEAGRVFPQRVWKSGRTEGEDASGVELPEKVNAHPSTEPSATSTVGPVMAAVQTVALGAAWK